jgi:hypothetical protein
MQAMARDKSFYADIACRDMKGDVILLIVTFAAFCSMSDEQYFNPSPPPPPPPPLRAACLRARCHWPDLDLRSLKPLARFHRDAMMQSGAHGLQHLAEEFALFQEVLAA